MPENTFIYDTVYEEFREELQFTDDEMSEAIMFWEDRSLFDELMYRVKRRKWQEEDELMYRVKRRKWQEEQRNKWIQGEQPEYTVPEDCPFWLYKTNSLTKLKNSTVHYVNSQTMN